MTTPITQEALDSAVAAARTEAAATAKAEGLKEGATNERARITAILDSDEGKKRPAAAASLAMKTDLPLDSAKAALAGMPEEKANTQPTGTPFSTAMENTPNPAVGADAPGSETQQANFAENFFGSFSNPKPSQPTRN